jgi:hypothetical protein
MMNKRSQESDRELLEYAAKAAGLRVGFEPNGVERGRYDLFWSYAHNQLYWHHKTAGSEYPRLVSWNPLTNSGDAFELAVKCLPFYTLRYSREDWEECNEDGLSATRRAIVKAAAEIGRNMK